MRLLRSNDWFATLFTTSSRCYRRGRSGRIAAHLLRTVVKRLYACDVSPATEVGDGLKVPHPVGIVIGSTARIGSGVVIMPNVVIAARDYPPAPNTRRHAIVGNRVLLGANSTIVGPITIGDDAVVGAGSVVTRDVPPASVVVGNPAREIKKRST